jgi:hypothetical protein
MKSEKIRVKSFASGIFVLGLKQSFAQIKFPSGGGRRSRPIGVVQTLNSSFFMVKKPISRNC